MRYFLMLIMLAWTAQLSAAPATTPSSTQPVGKLPHIQVNVKDKQVRVECEALAGLGPLEFLACAAGTAEHESVLRSRARPSHLHLALVMLGLQPGRGVHYDHDKKKWIEPSGPPLKMTVEFEKAGKLVTMPANETMRDIDTKKPMPEVTWVFTGSKIMPDNFYGADKTGYLVSVVNFELSPIDFPALASNANETLEWELNRDVLPEKGTKITLIIEPATEVKPPPPGTPPKPPPADAVSIPVVMIAGDGKVELNQVEITLDDLISKLKQMKGDRPLKVRVSAANGQASKVKVLGAIKELGVEVEEVAPPTTHQAN